MGLKARFDEQAITLEQYRRLDLQRPLTDKGIGHETAARRSHNARASRTFDDPGLFQADAKPTKERPRL